MDDPSPVRPSLSRRQFITTTAATVTGALALNRVSGAATVAKPDASALGTTRSAAPAVLQPFDYQDVKLLNSRWRDQYQAGRDFYYSVANDDILHGYRKAAGLPAPGQPLGGWAAKNSNSVFGQWLSGMARMYRATGDEAIRDKAVALLTEWGKTVGPDGNCRMDLYSYDKMLCGLVDLKIYAHVDAAVTWIDRTMPWVMATYSKERQDGRPDEINGIPHEWYTLAENVYRAYEVTGDERYKQFADTYLYHHFWDKFADTASPADAYHVHAYSHVNTFSSAAMAYQITGDPHYLNVIRNAYDYLQKTQCYATGGYGPMERYVPPDGTLGRSLEARNASFETVCGSWAAFKLARYLTRFTGEARYGDWIERLFYNGVGAALPITTGGKNFYYSDYRVTGGMKVYKVSRYTCCAGSYAQTIADYHNIIYYQDAASLYVNLYLPSEVTWQGPQGPVKVTQETAYPDSEHSLFRLKLDTPARFALKFRVPEWTTSASFTVNGKPVEVAATPGTWAAVDREWASGDVVGIRIPLTIRLIPVDPQHPRRVAVVRGPVVLVMDDWVFEEIPQLPGPEHLAEWLIPDDKPGVYRFAPRPGKKPIEARFRPFYSIGEVVPYRIYHDLDAAPIPVW